MKLEELVEELFGPAWAVSIDENADTIFGRYDGWTVQIWEPKGVYSDPIAMGLPTRSAAIAKAYTRLRDDGPPERGCPAPRSLKALREFHDAMHAARDRWEARAKRAPRKGRVTLGEIADAFNEAKERAS